LVVLRVSQRVSTCLNGWLLARIDWTRLYSIKGSKV